jgi:hypothetical protein
MSAPLSLVFGTAFEVHTTDTILDHPNVRPYHMGGAAYIGFDSEEIVHVCSRDCALRIISDEYFPGDDDDRERYFVSCHPYTSEHGVTVRTVDLLDFDRGDDPYVLCGECGTEIYRDDDAYLEMFGTPIRDEVSS